MIWLIENEFDALYINRNRRNDYRNSLQLYSKQILDNVFNYVLIHVMDLITQNIEACVFFAPKWHKMTKTNYLK